ncbi:dolichyl-phosphate-mannose-protein mannosyltransferase [Novosphingobium sp. PhB55]|uniref:glycosyltransferase family 39 protein n=1 Tax=Novosphingobium sp. PhB55 TaxID=2485106 RepID=UPI0010E39080|nr:glycosyltransferase family 39 protein [Novosphingobium sp. PhB55]TDW59627.1 dolichyl-phosphate-mannose-protein mannosyltransferase [Novosphingobium sp. PhB55]
MATPADRLTPAPRSFTAPHVSAAAPGGWIACAAILVFSLVLFQLNVHHGMVVTPDSTRYMGISPIPYDAPVYHWMLVLPHALGMPLLTAASAWALVTLVANVILIFALIRRTAADWRYAAIGTALIALAPQFVSLHAAVISEPPFITFVLLTLWFTLDYFERGARLDLLIASLMLGMATLTRFTAPPIGAAVVLVILANPRLPFGRRIADSALFAIPGAALFFVWVVASTLTVGHSIGRELRFYGNMGPAQWWANLETTAAWLLPDAVPLALRVLLLVAVLGFAGWQFARQLAAWRRVRPDATPRDEGCDPRLAFSLMLGLSFVGYLAFVWLSTALEANLQFVGRYGFPAYVMLVMMVTAQASGLDQRLGGLRTIWLTLAALAALVLVGHTVRTSARTYQVFREGIGFLSLEWRASPTIAAVEGLPGNASLFSNGPEVVALLTQRSAQIVPQERLLRTNRPDPANPPEAQLARIRAQADAGLPVYVVCFDRIDWRFYLASEQRLKRDLSLEPAGAFADGRIYRVKATLHP